MLRKGHQLKKHIVIIQNQEKFCFFSNKLFIFATENTIRTLIGLILKEQAADFNENI